MTSAERVAEYGRLTTEDEEHTSHAVALERRESTNRTALEPRHTVRHGASSGALVDPGGSWPGSGDVAFEGVQLRYAPHLPLALRGVDLHARAREKIGACLEPPRDHHGG